MRGEDARPKAEWSPPDTAAGHEQLVELVLGVDLRQLVEDARVAEWLAEQLDRQTLDRLLVGIRDAADRLDLDPETIRRAHRNPEIELVEAVPYGQALYWRIQIERWRIQREIHPPSAVGGRNWVPPSEDQTRRELVSQLVRGKGTRADQIDKVLDRLRDSRDQTVAELGRSGITGGA